MVIHNAPLGTRGPILDLSYEDLEKNFRVNTTALLILSQMALPKMLERESGTIIVTGNTAAERGKDGWGFFAASKSAQKILAESMAREFGPKGIHVAYIIIDALIDTPRTRPRLAPDKPDNFFASPKHIAEFAEIAKKAQLDTIDLYMSAGKEMNEEMTKTAKKTSNKTVVTSSE